MEKGPRMNELCEICDTESDDPTCTCDETAVTTTSGKPFTNGEVSLLARLIYRRFGDNAFAATAAWRRLLQNDAEVDDFLTLCKFDSWI